MYSTSGAPDVRENSQPCFSPPLRLMSCPQQLHFSFVGQHSSERGAMTRRTVLSCGSREECHDPMDCHPSDPPVSAASSELTRRTAAVSPSSFGPFGSLLGTPSLQRRRSLRHHFACLHCLREDGVPTGTSQDQLEMPSDMPRGKRGQDFDSRG